MSQTLTGISVGSVAPDFELKDQHGAKVSLSSFKGNKNVVALLFLLHLPEPALANYVQFVMT